MILPPRRTARMAPHAAQARPHPCPAWHRAPCRFQTCLFCYQKLNNEYSGACPGCRTPYGADPEEFRRQQAERKAALAAERKAAAAQAAAEAATARVSSTQGGYEAASSSSGGAPVGRRHSSGTGVAALPHQPPPPPPPPAQQQQQPQQPQQQQRLSHAGMHPAAEGVRPEDASQAEAAAASGAGAAPLPAGAKWGSSHVRRPSADLAPESAGGADESAWPVLSAAAAAAAAAGGGGGMGMRRQSSSSSLSSQHQHQQAAPAQQQRARGQAAAPGAKQQRQPPPGFNSIDVCTYVGGQRRAACVPLPGAATSCEASPYPEAVTLMQWMQQAVAAGSISAREAATQLLTLVNRLDAARPQQGGGAMGIAAPGSAAAAALTARIPGPGGGGASRPPPPGFGGGGAAGSRTQLAGAAGASGGSAAPALGRLRAASPAAPQHAAGTAAANGGGYLSQSTLHSVDSSSSLFSQGSALWNDSGLPGLDMGAPAAGPSLAAGAGGVPATLQVLWAGSSAASSRSGTPSAQQGKAAPPGFGGPAAAAAGAPAAGEGSRLNGHHQRFGLSSGAGGAAFGAGELGGELLSHDEVWGLRAASVSPAPRPLFGQAGQAPAVQGSLFSPQW